VLARDHRTCCVCQASAPLVVHHRRSSNRPSALITLCRAYHRALGEFFAWYQPNASGEGLTRATLQRYRSHLVALAALRKLAAEAAAHGGLSPVAATGIRGVPGAPASGPATG